MAEQFDKEDLINIIAVFLDKQGVKPYEVEPKENEDEDLLPDMIGVTKKEVEVQIAVQVETCKTLDTEEAEKKAKAIAEHVRRSGEGYMLFVPSECEGKAREKVKEWQIEDVVDIIPLGFSS
jgi:hypothetical protein